MAEQACVACGFSEEPLAFCTNCGSPRTSSVAVAIAPAVRPSEAAAASIVERGPSTFDKVVDGVSTVVCVIVGLVWAAIGVGIAVLGVTTGSAVGFLSLLCWAYAIWMFKPGGWKIIIY